MLVIKDFDMPNNCMQCNFTYEDSCCRNHCIFTYNEVWDCRTERRKDCPLVCEIPEDAVGIIGVQKGDTNGNVIKQMFPNSEAIFMLSNVAKTDVIKIENEAFLVDREWWNAPYKRGDEEC